MCCCALCTGSRRVFGTVIQNNCIFLIDTSGSMDVCMKELKKEMAALIWEQLNQRKIKYVLVTKLHLENIQELSKISVIT